jgi:hypothetical protein
MRFISFAVIGLKRQREKASFMPGNICKGLIFLYFFPLKPGFRTDIALSSVHGPLIVTVSNLWTSFDIHRPGVTIGIRRVQEIIESVCREGPILAPRRYRPEHTGHP